MHRLQDTVLETAMKRLLLPLLTFLLILQAIPAQATIFTYRARMDGLTEAPPNDSPAFGVSAMIVDDVEHTMQLAIGWAFLTSATTAAHIHCCTTDPFTGTAIPATMVPSFPGFPTDARGDGLYEATFDLLDSATYNPAFITASGGSAADAEAAFLAGLASGRSYVNIHTLLFPNGEIRGFYTPPPEGGTVPEPGSTALLGLGAACLALLRGRSRRTTPARAPLSCRLTSPYKLRERDFQKALSSTLGTRKWVAHHEDATA
jgi:hypothetical protein